MIEICIDSVESAVNAEHGGARRVELCANLVEGGTTPSAGMLRRIKQCVNVPVFVMIRPRGGDFCFSDHEFHVMKTDIQVLKEYGADGIVTGILNSECSVDNDRCIELVDLSRPLPVTFHRAIDVTRNIEQALETVIALGCERVLTSGGENTALEGAPTIRKLIELVLTNEVQTNTVLHRRFIDTHGIKRANQRIVVMPGGGITERNLRRILDETGAQEFHCSARVSKDSAMQHTNTAIHMGAMYGPQENQVKVTSSERVKDLLRIANQAM